MKQPRLIKQKQREERHLTIIERVLFYLVAFEEIKSLSKKQAH